jgi:hypothetical protein
VAWKRVAGKGVFERGVPEPSRLHALLFNIVWPGCVEFEQVKKVLLSIYCKVSSYTMM